MLPIFTKHFIYRTGGCCCAQASPSSLDYDSQHHYRVRARTWPKRSERRRHPSLCTLHYLYAAAICAIGKTGDANAFTDASAKVFDAQGLRVMDNLFLLRALVIRNSQYLSWRRKLWISFGTATEGWHNKFKDRDRNRRKGL